MTSHLRGRNDFQRVYRNGRRYEGSFISVFVLLNQQPGHRFGVTASRKAVGKAVDRNRAKRLLRESFRLSSSALRELHNTYDWAINAKARIAGRKLSVAMDELTRIIEKVARDESKSLASSLTT